MSSPYQGATYIKLTRLSYIDIYCSTSFENGAGAMGSGMVLYRDGVPQEEHYGNYQMHATMHEAELSTALMAVRIAEGYVAVGCNVLIHPNSKNVFLKLVKAVKRWSEVGGVRGAFKNKKHHKLGKEICEKLLGMNGKAQLINTPSKNSLKANKRAKKLAECSKKDQVSGYVERLI